jgi:mono/diheme cytochrome c family protein/glucose/arabinose dehydrogenase
MMRPSIGPSVGLLYVREPSNKGGGKRRGRLTRIAGGLHIIDMRMPRRSHLLAALCLAAAPLCAQIGDKAGEPQVPIVPANLIPPSRPLSAEEALRSFKVAPGYRIELVAEAPLVRHPTVLQFAPDGRLWVVEMTGYMEDFDGTTEAQAKGSVVVLSDTDGDGRMDKRTVFLDNIILPRALVLHRDGVLVGAPPHLWFCRDTDGDGKADEKTEVATDFGVRVDPSRPQLANPERAPNALLWGHDGWLYAGAYTARFKFTDGKWVRENSTFRGQWGLAQDDYGRLYSNNNSDLLRVDVVNSSYLLRNPYLGRNTGLNTKAAVEQTVWPARVNPGINRGYRAEMLRDFKLKECTAACGPWIYRSALFPADAYGNAFICEPAGNLVKRLVLNPDKGLVNGTAFYDQQEFVASTDERFRPVNALTGPEGALYLVDMHHGVIQHRISLTSYLRKQGEDRGLISPLHLGRLWRVVPEGHKTTKLATLTGLKPADLITELGNGNEWRRETAQRLLIEGGDKTLAAALTAFGREAASPMGRVHALWTQHGLGVADWTLVSAGLADADPRVRAAALRVSEALVAGPQRADVIARWTALAASEAVPEVQVQLALTMGEAKDLGVDLAAAALAQRAAEHIAIQDAFISGLAGRELEVFAAVLKQPAAYSKTLPAALLRCVFAERKPARVAQALAIIGSHPLRSQQLTLLGSLATHPTVTAKRPIKLEAEPAALAKLAKSKDAAMLKALAWFKSTVIWPGKPGVVVPATKALTNEELALFDNGRQTFAGLCAACHQPTGKGLEGLAPPLAESEWVLGEPDRIVKVVMHGLRGPIKVKGMTYSYDMPAAGFLTDEQIAGVLTYIRREWDHEASPVSVDLVKKIRAENKGRTDAWTDGELQKK